jgi:energy-coupling factor transport system ATP-binding protein
VIDEADAFLDQPGRELLREVTKSLAKTGSILIRVSHDLNSIDDDERLFLIQNGELTECKNSHEIRTNLFSDASAPVSEFDSLPPSPTLPTNEKKEISRLKLDACNFSPADGLEVGQFSLELEGDCWTGLSGPNGSGKTLLGKFLAGLYPSKPGYYRMHFSSQAVVDAHTILTNPSHVGYLPSEPERFLIAATVAECFKDSDSDKSLEYWARHFEFDLTRYGSRDPLSLSGGEQRRLALLMALQFDPAFLVLDEPTANLDFNGRASVLSFLKMWKTHGRGGLLISHDQELLQSSCDRMLTLG